VAISSDFIVGLCGETEASFEKTASWCGGALQEQLYLQYSPARHQGRRAVPDDVPEEVKKRRNNDLLALQNAVSLLGPRQRIGSTVRGAGRGFEQDALKHEAGS